MAKKKTGRSEAIAATPSPAATVAPEPKPQNQYLLTTWQASRCPRCESTERTGYFATVETANAGEIDGQRYTHVVRRRTKCTSCGQHRIDRSYENRTARAAD